QPPVCLLEEFSSFLAHLEEALALMISSHRSEEELIRLSYYDALTNLPNRRLFLDRLNHAIAMARREREKLAVLYMDLNRFKPINDTLGHEAGDMVLRECAKRFRRFLRESDTAARLGGDEFAVLLPKTSAEMALNVAKKLLFSLQEPIRLPRQEVTIGTSIGIATYPDDGEQAETLLKHADAAMYRAKKNHGHIHYFSQEMEEDARRILALEQDLSQIVDKGALKLHYLSKAGALTDTDKAHHAFPVFYQPKHRLSDQRMIGLESLVRWRHPILGLVAPSEFIHLAEETGYIHQISEWVIFQSCLQAAEWEREGLLPGRIAINISAVQLMHEGLAQDILKIIHRADAKPEWVEIEITETAVMHDPEIAARVMQELVDAGISISIDDFGTGHSSLAYLKRFPVDTLKIDKTFIRGLPDDNDDLAIVRSIVAMAHALDIQVLAEGIEKTTQLDVLTACDCDLGQGFLFGRPSTAKDIRQLLQHQLRSDSHPQSSTST
ncbi:MAG: EAL domain-containing protein, partial [Zetaproteobacteria bacterium]